MDKLLAASLALAFAWTPAFAHAASRVAYSPPMPAVVYAETAVPADSFADSAGFDASFEDHQYPPLVTAELEWSGIRHLRDGGPPSQLLVNLFADLGRHGIMHSVGMRAGFTASTLEANLKAFAPYVDIVEPANEADNVTHPNWAQMRSDQARLYQTVRADPAYARVAVLGPSFANPLANAPLVGPLDKYEDYGQIHNSTCDWEPSIPGAAGIDANIVKIRASTVYKPLVTTETGYGDDRTRGCSLPDDNISRYIPRELALRFMAGMPRTYFTFLVVKPSDVAFGSLGMLQTTGVPKAQFLTLATLARFAADPGIAIPARKVTYAISNATSDVAHLILARRDGSYDLLIWRELPSWDHHLRAEIPVSSETVRVTLPAGMTYAGLFTPNAAYGATRTQLPISGGVTAPFAISDRMTTLHLYGARAVHTSVPSF